MTDADRTTELTRILTERRHEIGSIVHTTLRQGRSRERRDVRDLGEDSVVEHQDDLDLSLLQMRAETLERIDEALIRLAAGKYGICAVCALEISAPRLRALPFAVRCKKCEDRREQNSDRLREFTRKSGGLTLVADSASA